MWRNDGNILIFDNQLFRAVVVKNKLAGGIYQKNLLDGTEIVLKHFYGKDVESIISEIEHDIAKCCFSIVKYSSVADEVLRELIQRIDVNDLIFSYVKSDDKKVWSNYK